ncbi:sel1 repeat family protein [Fluoribacter dumoffii]|uniref:Polar organelle development protein n=1 Tax=Fluoribacter dumoffii TaxID=463 RepID=A0A377GEQ1_9GAMM|nr:tetratricopeptide repeat protein [Fluoribacter dumoffii]KTC91281.1 TPR repeat protein [Fluoribacter dumoffii NY 23]MCW8387550.1 sel1 repeat family protein [Fluoribacter dumoffii]MCW8497753.1 sel1 repeat family protein [Fluoribacter dumoffii]STO22981.1 Polar organelle development protein [Fluoribacter dumoffii]
MKCPECHYTRKNNETVPEWQCPNCGIAYNKHPNYTQTSHKIKLLYKKIPKDYQIKANTIYVYLIKYRFDVEHIQFAFKEKEDSIVRLGLPQELANYAPEIFQILSGSNQKLKKHHKQAIINSILKENLQKNLSQKKDTEKLTEESNTSQNPEERKLSNLILDTIAIIMAIIGILLLIFIEMDYYIFKPEIFIEKTNKNTVRNSISSENYTNKTINNSPINFYTLTSTPNQNQNQNLSFDSEGVEGLSILLGENGYKQNINEGIKLLTKSAEKGNRRSQYNLGVAYYSGYVNYIDEKKALFWFTKAAENGEEKAQYNLGIMYLRGEGTAKNKNKALYWFKKSAEQGFEPAINFLSSSYELNNMPVPVYKEIPSNKFIYKKKEKNGTTLFTDNPD